VGAGTPLPPVKVWNHPRIRVFIGEFHFGPASWEFVSEKFALNVANDIGPRSRPCGP
jgi:hypothetical protein